MEFSHSDNRVPKWIQSYEKQVARTLKKLNLELLYDF